MISPDRKIGDAPDRRYRNARVAIAVLRHGQINADFIVGFSAKGVKVVDIR